jgi:pSer/pThr/pTyr-binding forkhead associated (FHA) protein
MERVHRNEEGEKVKISTIKPYLMDLKATHGTTLNGKKIEDSRYYELHEMDCIKFGESTREYMILHDHLQENNNKSSSKHKNNSDDDKDDNNSASDDES